MLGSKPRVWICGFQKGACFPLLVWSRLASYAQIAYGCSCESVR